MLPFLDTITDHSKKLTASSGVRPKPRPVFILGLVLLLLSFILMPRVVALSFSLALFLAPLWLPVLLVNGALLLWLILKRSEFIASQKTVLLEIRPPRAIVKTPLAMEAFLSGMHLQPGEATWYRRYIKGAVRPWWSLEIASIEGRVHFFIWTRANFRRIIESQMYAQYPGVQITEAPDYTRLITATPEEWEIWGCDFVHTEKDPLPIKTYVEYGLDKVQKEEEQVDPLANLIEFMGSMKKGENLWLQITIRTHKGEKYNKLNKSGKPYTWKDEAKELIDEIRKATREPYKDAAGNEVPGFPNPTKGQMEKIAAIERNVSKLSFDVGIRGVYIATREKFDPVVITGLTGIFKQFSADGGWNGFKPSGWMTSFDDYPWEFGVNAMKNAFRKGLVAAYRRRQFFHEPVEAATMVMSTEEIATIYHIPSSAIAAPSLERILSATGEAPPNLPT